MRYAAVLAQVETARGTKKQPQAQYDAEVAYQDLLVRFAFKLDEDFPQGPEELQIGSMLFQKDKGGYRCFVEDKLVIDHPYIAQLVDKNTGERFWYCHDARPGVRYLDTFYSRLEEVEDYIG